MGRVMGCGLCPYNAIEKVGNYGFNTCQVKQLIIFTAAMDWSICLITCPTKYTLYEGGIIVEI